jgi:hypothetical protein
MNELEEKEARLNAVRQLLDGSDYKAIKHSEGAITDGEYATVKAQRQAWREEVNSLEAAIRELESSDK